MIKSLKDKFIDKLLKEITKKNKIIEGMKCCGNCNNVFYGTKSGSGFSFCSEPELKCAVDNRTVIESIGVCKKWEPLK